MLTALVHTVFIFLLKNNPLLILITFSVLVQLANGDAQALLEYRRAEILSGELWRVLSGHIVHLNWRHLLLNCSAMLLLWGLLSPVISNTRIWAAVLLSMLGISAQIMILSPEVDWYVGLSGVLHGLLVLAAYNLGIQHRLIFAGLLMMGLVYKLLTEQISTTNITLTGNLIGDRVIVDAHLYGAVCGLIVVAYFWLSNHETNR